MAQAKGKMMIKAKTDVHFYYVSACLLSLLLMTACSHQNKPSANAAPEAIEQSVTLYAELGGKSKISEIASLFLDEVSYHPDVLPYFQNTNIGRFEEKFIEHLCLISGGPCQYTGDTMAQVHAGMAITEADFNAVVELMINAMSRAGIAHNTQNKLLARLVPMRKDIIYQ